MPEAWDCYVFSRDRSPGVVLSFLERFAEPSYRPSWDANDPWEVLGVQAGADLDGWLSHLSAHPTVAYTFYWTVESDRIANCIAAFTADGGLILGTSVPNGLGRSVAAGQLRQLEAFAQADAGYIALEEAPAASGEQFAARCKVWTDRSERNQ